MTPADIARYRLAAQQITATQIRTAPELVAWLGAVQGQEYAQAKWALGLRLPHLKDEAIEDDLTTGRIVRTHILRPTWHFVAASDLRWLLSLSAPRVHTANAFMYREAGLDKALLNRCCDIMAKRLGGGSQLTREELNEELKRHDIEASGHRLSYIMMYAELEGILCSGARKGKTFTYALLDDRVPPSRIMSREEALAILTGRYFTSRGPATLKDYATWSGLTVADCKKGIALMQPALACAKPDGQEYYFSPQIALPDKKDKRVFLLPIYDEYIMGYKNRNAIMQYSNTISAKPSFTFNNTIVQDGQIIGTWKRTLGSNRIDLVYEFFLPPAKIVEKEFERAVRRFSEFSGMEVRRAE